MEIETHVAEVYTSVKNLPRKLESTNTVTISLYELIKHEAGMVTLLGSDRVRLKPRGGFTSHHLSRLLCDQQVPESQYLGETIARDIKASLDNDHSLREPVFVTVDVNFIRERRLISPPPPPPVLPTPSRGASREVLQRLAKEQRVEPKDLVGKNETQCSICIEDWSNKSHKNIIELPQCLHMFHQHCLFEWLGRQNSCPLCRSTVSFHTIGSRRNRETQRLT
ncbi:hypothetical protein EUTSA_v10028317mg [Eutrema salsugineum]|uniref:RING-type domain-containing protein n=1 Tax=Eutrema salsugineum TaxID=72664 RepID=V4LA42_EUTSA|nr:E3 ubiquitin-protein ligase SDIR1 [Eutrema salsugineum]ESQ47300.1 hypothetical protein EUTSA_v10028317mg [Eutrema salsugineum]